MTNTFTLHRDWSPFQIADEGAHAEAPRSIHTQEGIHDRLRAAAFAELQARDAFDWAAQTLSDASESLKTAWRGLVLAEDRHLNWLLTRMKELGVNPSTRKVSDHLWLSLLSCKTAEEFAVFMANAEERGRRAGVRFAEALSKSDPISAEIFRKIAEEEVEHIQLAQRYFPNSGAGLGADADQKNKK